MPILLNFGGGLFCLDLQLYMKEFVPNNKLICKYQYFWKAESNYHKSFK